MKIGIIGAGAIGQAFAGHAGKANFEVVISNSRGADSLKEITAALGENVSPGSIKDAAQADIVFISLPWQSIKTALSGLDLKGKIVIDPTNAILPGFEFAPLNGRTSSEIVQELIPGARLVKAFNTLPAAILALDPKENQGKRVVFLSGDDKDGKEVVSTLIQDLGFAPIDLGNLKEGGKLQQFPGEPFATLNLIKLP